MDLTIALFITSLAFFINSFIIVRNLSTLLEKTQNLMVCSVHNGVVKDKDTMVRVFERINECVTALMENIQYERFSILTYLSLFTIAVIDQRYVFAVIAMIFLYESYAEIRLTKYNLSYLKEIAKSLRDLNPNYFNQL